MERVGVQDASQVQRPEVAENLREAAKRLLAGKGFSAVTIDAVAREAGEYRASIAYYFGGKSGLLAAVADDICPRQACVEAVAACEQYPPGPMRVKAQMTALQAMAEDMEAFRAFFELFPHILRDEDLRRKLVALYEWYRELDMRMFGLDGVEPDELKYSAAIVLAAVDGLAFQACLDPDNFHLEKALSLSWAERSPPTSRSSGATNRLPRESHLNDGALLTHCRWLLSTSSASETSASIAESTALSPSQRTPPRSASRLRSG